MFRIICVALYATLSCALADPMRPDPPRSTASTQSVNQATLSLESIYILDQRAYAVINGQWLSVDERLGNLRVVSIDADQVVIQGAGGQRILTPAQSSGSLHISMSDED
ncbi:hypothetical protein ABMA57_13460 [Saccharospirillum sp. HFRX-1]|uniref:hypothetical protein n=1 Tax=unclassified Saccharospirillum TaxID=2633430 RepID=UPI00371494C7